MSDKFLIHLCIDGTRQGEWRMKIEKKLNEILSIESKIREKEGRETLKNCGDATPMIRDGTFHKFIKQFQKKEMLNIFLITPPVHRGVNNIEKDEECKSTFLKIFDSLNKEFPTVICKYSFNERKFPRKYELQVKGLMVTAFVHGAVILDDLDKVFYIVENFVRSK